MRILHIASFIGNIGDNASHIGLQSILDRFVPSYEVTRVEIRKFYKNYRHEDKLVFDGGFIRYINSYDLVIIGGGGFLDYWVPDSASGTTIDIEPSLVSGIRTPTFIISVGCFPHKDIPPGNVEKFRAFLDAVLSNNYIRLAVRNDGSLTSLRNTFGSEYAERIPEVVDNGFFFRPKSNFRLPLRRKYVALNIVADQIEMLSNQRGAIDKTTYYSELAEIVRYVVYEMGLDIVLIPHIYQDLQAISNLISTLDDFLVRSHVAIAPYIQGDEGAESLFSVYRDSEAVIATRLHANICSLAMGKITVGLAALDRVSWLHRSIGSETYVMPVGGFSKDVTTMIQSSDLDFDCVEKNIFDKEKCSLDFYQNILSSI